MFHLRRSPVHARARRGPVNNELALKRETEIDYEEKMPARIPAPIIAVVSETVASWETHVSLDNLFMYAGAPGAPPAGSKGMKAQAWLRTVNKEHENPIEVLGKILEPYLEEEIEDSDPREFDKIARNMRVQEALAKAGLQYIRGGHISRGTSLPSKTLEGIIRHLDATSINEEFDRALRNVEANPKEAVSAACNILESICRVYIEDQGLELPQKQDLQPLWNAVRKDLNFDPAIVEDQDLQKILSGLISVVAGIGSLRTHASTAHGAGRKAYRIEPRHARLAIHSAHTVSTFIIESWGKKKKEG